jgi:hypothetical protein
MPTPQQQEDKNAQPQVKKSYEAPILVEWGTFRELTANVGARGAPDGQTKGPKNTSL